VPNSKFGKFAHLIRNKLFNFFYNIYFFSISILTFEQTRFNIWKKINIQFFITFFVEIGVRPDEWRRVGGEARSRRARGQRTHDDGGVRQRVRHVEPTLRLRRGG
jgi:hypothetical protein